MSKVFITGVSGYLGTALAARLLHDGHEVAGCDVWDSDQRDPRVNFVRLDVTSRDTLASLLVETQPDVIYHYAALSHVLECEGAPEMACNTNVYGTECVLHAMLRMEKKSRLVFAGSGEEYGEGVEILASSKLIPKSVYAATKAAASTLALGFAAAKGLDVHVVRMANLYGPGANQDSRKLIPLVIDRLLQQTDIELRAPRDTYRDWLYIDDAVNAHVLVGFCAAPLIVNLPGKTETTVHDVATTIADLLNLMQPTKAADSIDPPCDYRRYLREVTNVSPGRRVVMSKRDAFYAIGWEPTTPLFTGLTRTVRAALTRFRETAS